MILYKGPSLLDGEPIMVVATGYKSRSANAKTGQMVQTWIIRSDVNPWEASKQGSDSSVCGDCPHRWSTGGACYVNLRTPNTIYRAASSGRYDQPDYKRAWQRFLADKSNWTIRLGAYGDPAAVPREIWDNLLDGCKGHTGYTHQWHKPQGQAILDLCMASADTPDQAKLLEAAGARYFQVVAPGDEVGPNSVTCLAESKGKSCSECRICDGLRVPRVLKGMKQPTSVHIKVHGARKSRFLNVIQ